MQRLLSEMQRSLLQTRLMNSELNILLIKTAIDTSKFDNNSANKILYTSEEQKQQIEQQLDYWKRVTDRVRAQSSQHLIIADTTDLNSKQQKELQNVVEKAAREIAELQNFIELNHFIENLLRQRMLAGESTWVRSIKSIMDSMATLGSHSLDLFSATLFEANETPVTTLGLLRVMLILTIAWWVSKIIRRTIQHVGTRRKAFSDSALYTLGRMVHYFVITIGIVIGLSSIGIDLTKFVLFASALGVGVGFGLQTLVSNFVAGLIILFEKSLKVGDFVELQSGVVGEVREINLRSTLVTTNDTLISSCRTQSL